MTAYTLTNRQARRFILLKQGFAGNYRFSGKSGVLEFIHQAGCIQYDPIDVCGKNAELVLQSRVNGFTKPMLDELLYKDRTLLDYFDKNLSIIETCDWPSFGRCREEYRNGGRSRDEVNAVCDTIKSILRERGPVSSADIGFNEKVHWYWSDTRLSRAALETMYFRGDLVIHHKKGSIKYYDLAENCIPNDILSLPDDHLGESDHMKWHVLRRIFAVGLLWNKHSDAWLNIEGLNAAARDAVFRELADSGEIIGITVEGMKESLYCPASDQELLETVLDDKKSQSTAHRPFSIKPRCELIAPLDNMLWDRKLIKELFGFDYKWEIYTPPAQRKYGYYTLPLLYGDRFIGRAEIVNNRRHECLEVKNIWFEDGVKRTKKLHESLNQCIRRFAEFNGCALIRNGGEKDG